MTRLRWDIISERVAFGGVDRGAFFPEGAPAVAWSGLVSVQEEVDSESTPRYFNGRKYRNRNSPGEFKCTIAAFSNPFGKLRRGGLTYRVRVGDTYQIHLIYQALLSDSAVPNATINSDVDPRMTTFNVSTLPLALDDGVVGSHLVVHADRVYPWVLSDFEDLLYGTELTQPVFPTPAEVLAVFEEGAIVRITDHGDGTWTAEGPDSAVYMTDATEFVIDWPSAVYLDGETYVVRSL